MSTTRDLFLWLPKLLDIVEEPLPWVLLLLIVSLLLFWRGRERAARRTLALAILLFAFLGVVAVPEAILQRLENAYPATSRAGVGESVGPSEARGTVTFFDEQGISPTRLIVEPTSRNTFEIAENVQALPGIDLSRPWLLLTSAWNMPRALLAFRKTGWNVEPLPVDYVTGTTIDYFRFSILSGANAWSRVLHEVLGIAWYRVTGRL